MSRQKICLRRAVYGKSDKKQRYKYQECNRRFRDNLGFEHRHTPPMFITLCLLLHETGTPAVRLPHILSYVNVTVSTNTITKWMEHYTCMAETYTDSIRPPNLGNKLSADEKRQDIGGRERYMVMAMDMATKFILAWEVSPIKIRHDVANLLRKALNRAGKPYRIFITDGPAVRHTRFKKVFWHIEDICHSHTVYAHQKLVLQHQHAGAAQWHAGLPLSYVPGIKVTTH